MSKPFFFSQPFRYMRWASYEKPAIFYSLVIGSLGPVALFTLPPIRRYFGDVDPAEVPFSYPGTLHALTIIRLITPALNKKER
ncbi:NADH-ubiquinone oxidoreductase subunit [Arthroderma uncinatum]|uniref:NADH-ubiquinone oxidoreductase subunit n=1 Tax=Arthroderma uncinatum TaxID=74035 RepID=UPI00144A75FE|nr:NADH-ubiquinone oxidoreductase subunit [Arthroderma uncinatum]KAF3479712.1 NADH-ubiquinone oxidoreductase subunit [Arthroderma uncinatum]